VLILGQKALPFWSKQGLIGIDPLPAIFLLVSLFATENARLLISV
jgi:hypothetical protein